MQGLKNTAVTIFTLLVLLACMRDTQALVAYHGLTLHEKYDAAAFVGTIELDSWVATNVLFESDLVPGSRFYCDVVRARVVRVLKGECKEGEYVDLSIIRFSAHGSEEPQVDRPVGVSPIVDPQGRVLLSTGSVYNVLVFWSSYGPLGLREVLDEKAWNEMLGIHERIQRYGYDPEDPRHIRHQKWKERLEEYQKQSDQLWEQYQSGQITLEEYWHKHEEIRERMNAEGLFRFQCR